MSVWKTRRAKYIVAAVLLALSLQGQFLPASAQLLRDEWLGTGSRQQVPIYRWQDASQKAKRAIITVHGLAMHGTVFDTLARKLAFQGAVVYSLDLRGYGRWWQRGAGDEAANTVAYDDSYLDLTSLALDVRLRHPDIPVYILGESIGGTLTLHLASEHPELCDAIILSSPALKMRSVVTPRRLQDLITSNFKPAHQIDLVPYMENLVSEDSDITAGALSDPLVRKKLTAREIWRSIRVTKPTLSYAHKVPPHMPVLVMQGKLDKIVDGDVVNDMATKMPSYDQTVKWFPDKGHLLVETSYLKPEVLETITTWLASEEGKSTVASTLPGQSFRP